MSRGLPKWLKLEDGARPDARSGEEHVKRANWRLARKTALLGREVSQLPERYRAMLSGLTAHECIDALHVAIVHCQRECAKLQAMGRDDNSFKELLFNDAVAWARDLPKYQLPPRSHASPDDVKRVRKNLAGVPLSHIVEVPRRSRWRLRPIPREYREEILALAYLQHCQTGKSGIACDDEDFNKACQEFWNDRSFDTNLTPRDLRRKIKTAEKALNAAQASGDLVQIEAAKLALGKLPKSLLRVAYHTTDEEEANAAAESGEDVELGAEEYVGAGDGGLADLKDKLYTYRASYVPQRTVKDTPVYIGAERVKTGGESLSELIGDEGAQGARSTEEFLAYCRKQFPKRIPRKLKAGT